MKRLGQSVYRLSESDNNTQHRLICFPFAGGTLRYFEKWPNYLEGWDVLGVLQAGRSFRFREEPLGDIYSMARQTVDDMEAASLLDQPYALFGHSIGGAVAYETAREIARRNLPEPEVLCIASTPAPHLFFNEDPAASSNEGLKNFLRSLGMDMSVFNDHSDTMGYLWPGIRADLMAFNAYKPDTCNPLVNTPILMWIGTKDPSVSIEEMQQWQEYTTKSTQLTRVPAGHSYMEEEIDRILPQIAEVMTAGTGECEE